MAPTVTSSTYPPLVEFARWAIQNSAFAGGDLCGGKVQDKAEALGLLNRVPFDPKIHANLEHTFAPGERLFVFSDLLTSSPAVPPAGGKGAASLRDAAPDQFAYLAVHDGVCTEASTGLPPADLGAFFRSAGADGGYVERVPLEVARQALYRPWPQFYAVQAPTPAPDLEEKVARIMDPDAWAALGKCESLPYQNRRMVSLRRARAAIQVVQEAQWHDISANLLWCMHVRGPDDVVPMFSYPAAVEACDKLNRFVERLRQKPDASPNDPEVRAYPAIWPWSADQHAKCLREGNREYGIPALPLPPLSKGGE